VTPELLQGHRRGTDVHRPGTVRVTDGAARDPQSGQDPRPDGDGRRLGDLHALLVGVSRTPVREALIRLVQEGLIDSGRGKGTRVADLHLDSARHLFAVGAVLDAEAAGLATDHMTADDAAAMHRILREMEDTTQPARLAELDGELHAVYYTRCGNPVLREMLADIEEELTRIERHAWGQTPIRSEAHDEHRDLLAAFDRRDARAAAAARRNWERSWQRIADLLER
jgi:DNA-binding GntR family transcriptional regulator